MRARISQVYRALVWACCLSSLACANDLITSTVWRQLTSDLVVTFHEISNAAAGGYLGTKLIGSRVECVSECNSHPDCFSVTFDPTSGDCYLQPDLSNDQTQPAHLGQMWAKEDSTCHTDKASISNGAVGWDHTLTSLRGIVTCNEESMKTTDDVSVTCMAGGSWLREGECVRHIWTNPPLSIFPLDVPFPVIDGWTVCVEGIPTDAIRFSVDLMVGSNSRALHASFRIDSYGETNTIMTSYRLNGVWVGGVWTQMDPFPFSVDIPFLMKFKATNVNTFEIYVDDMLTVTRSQHTSLPASDVTRFRVINHVNVTRLDLWCHN